MTASVSGAGSIYDLGYRPYEGARLGRSYAFRSLFLYSLRSIFGISRSVMAKVFPIGLAAVALLPAVVQLGVAAIAPADIRLIRPENYFEFVEIVLVLFCAVTAPELIGRDQRYHVLPLYFSRALSRGDYLAAKASALFAALLAVSLAPQLVLFAGSAVAASNLGDYVLHNADILAPMAASSLVIAAFMSAVSLTLGSQTPRRAYATVAVLAYFVIFGVVGGILVETTTGTVRQYVVLISPNAVLEGATRWIFSAPAPANSPVARAGLDGSVYFAAAVAYAVAALGLLSRKFQRLTA
jgi:ABC-2 type transport system permease protein